MKKDIILRRADTGTGQVNQKLIVITRQDLPPGCQAVQSAHAAIEFQHEHVSIAKQWNTESKYLILLSVRNEKYLLHLLEKIKKHELKYSVFKEPDINNQITAIAIEPCEKSKKICSNLPLALKEIEK